MDPLEGFLSSGGQTYSPTKTNNPPPVIMSAAETQADQDGEQSSSSLDELSNAIKTAKTPQIKATLQGELDRIKGSSDPLEKLMSSGGFGDSDKPATPSASLPSKYDNDPIRQKAEADANDIGEGLVQGVANRLTGAGASIVSGFRGLADLATGGDLNTAANAVRDYQGQHTYQPTATAPLAKKTIEGLNSGYNPANWIPKGIEVVGDTAGGALADAGLPGAGAVVKGAATAAPLALGMRGGNEAIAKPAIEPVVGPSGERISPTTLGPSGERVPSSMEAMQQQFNQQGGRASMGAAGLSDEELAKASVQNASPEIQQEVNNKIAAGAKIDQEALNRQVEADSLPVKISLTEGQASQDPTLISQEQNSRGRNESLVKRFNEQNQQLIENTNAIKEDVAPDVYAQTLPEHGDLIIDAYKAKDDALSADVSAKYKALTDANGGNLPLDVNQLKTNIDTALQKDLLTDHVPPAIASTLKRLTENGSMNFENFEALRTNLARVQRSAADGNERAASGVIRDQLENLPLSEGAENLKALADTARAAARNRFQLIANDPAYKAVVNGKASADKFISKYLVGADTKDVQTMVNNLSDAPVAKQALGSGVINYLKGRANLTNNTGNFGQAGYNKALAGVQPKLNLIMDPAQASKLQALGNVARNVQSQPKGSYVNNSNTLVGAMAEHAKTTAEMLANAKFGGLPVGSAVRNFAQRKAFNNYVNNALKPGAGIEKTNRLSDFPK